ncbi:MAG: protein translocase subunit SecDF [Bacteroidetes bacterium]|nr:protein translocase subunit SecDF [Bacteroidota bacterium]
MRNRSILWTFVILLAVAVLYSLSFGWVASQYEKNIHQLAVDSIANTDLQGEAADIAIYELERKMLRDSSEAKAYPVFDHTYSYLKQHELSLGLDLKGGMSVTLEVSIPDLVIALSDYNETPAFTNAIKEAVAAQRNSTEDFISLFEKSWKNQNSNIELWTLFSNYENKEKFPAKASDSDIIAALRKEANDAIDNTENIIRKRIDQFGVTQPNVQKQSLTGRIIVELPGVSDRERVRKNLKSTANLEFWDTYFNTEIFDVVVKINENLGKASAPELFGLSAQMDTTDSASIAAVDSTKIKADSLLTKEESRKKNPLFALLDPRIQSGNSMVGMARVSDTSAINKLLARPEARQAMAAKPELRLMWSAKPIANVVSLYAIKDPSLKGKAQLDGKSIVDARQDFDPTTGDVTVEMTMDPEVGTPVWRDMTKKNAADNKRAIAIVMDNLVYSAPSVNSEIPNGRSVITLGTGSRDKQIEEAKDLAGLLKAGSLPAPAKIIDEVTVGPTLGEENIKAGLWSFAMAFIVILIYMVFYYAWAGWAANVALIANLFFLVGAMISIGGALTLPGIAGIVLTMGMAVDANVLIYERVKEELRLGKPINAAMKDGFLKAVSAIVDGNATTLITGLVLLVIGTGPIKGFATTLIIGIFTTLFTAIIISRLILYKRLDSKKSITFYSNITKNWFTKVNYDFVTKRKMFYAISILIIGAGMVSWMTRGFNMGVDFAGGTSYKVTYVNAVDAENIRSAMNASLIESNGNVAATSVQSIGSDNKSFKITTNFMMDSNDANTDEMVSAKVNEGLKAVGTEYTVDSSYKVDATMSDDFRTEAFWSTIIGLILVGIYIFIRFQKWDFAVGAAAALAHDALIVVSAFTLLNGLVPFSMEVNQNFIGAILTVIGYSINDTVVIFDRIREYFNTRKNPELKSTINDALNSTLGRSINTSLTVLLTLLVMFFFGSDDIKGFCFAMIVGVVSGVYSTLFIATPIVVDMRNWLGKKEK